MHQLGTSATSRKKWWVSRIFQFFKMSFTDQFSPQGKCPDHVLTTSVILGVEICKVNKIKTIKTIVGLFSRAAYNTYMRTCTKIKGFQHTLFLIWHDFEKSLLFHPNTVGKNQYKTRITTYSLFFFKLVVIFCLSSKFCWAA